MTYYEGKTVREAFRKALGRDRPNQKSGLEDELQALRNLSNSAIMDSPAPADAGDRARCERLNAAMQDALIEWRDMEAQQQELLNRFRQLNNSRLVTDLMITSGVVDFRRALLNGMRFLSNVKNGIGAILSRQPASEVRNLFGGSGSGSGGGFAAAVDGFDASITAMDLPGLIQRHRELTEQMNSEEMRAMMSVANALETGWQQKRDLYRSIARDYENFDCERFGVQSIGRAP